MGHHRTTLVGLSALALTAALTGTATADPAPLTCAIAPGADCPTPNAFADARVDAQPLACARVVIDPQDGQLVFVRARVSCPPLDTSDPEIAPQHNRYLTTAPLPTSLSDHDGQHHTYPIVTH